MKILLKITSIIIFWLLLSGFTLSSSTDSNMEGFDTKELTFSLSSSCSTAPNIESLIKEAMNLWNSVPTSNLKLKLGSTVSTTVAQARSYSFTDTTVISCSTSFSSETSGQDPNLVAGIGHNIGYTSGARTQGYLVLNYDTYVQGSTDASLNNPGMSDAQRKIIIAHEIGHVLGLGHSEEVSALMHASVASKTNLNLHQDDIDGFSYLYPRDELSGDPMLGCGSMKSNAPPSNPGRLLLFLLPLLIILILKIDRGFKTPPLKT